MSQGCSVCFEGFENTTVHGQPVVIVGCGHLFHEDCIKSWMDVRKGQNLKMECAMCKVVVCNQWCGCGKCDPIYQRVFLPTQSSTEQNPFHYLHSLSRRADQLKMDVSQTQRELLEDAGKLTADAFLEKHTGDIQKICDELQGMNLELQKLEADERLEGSLTALVQSLGTLVVVKDGFRVASDLKVQLAKQTKAFDLAKVTIPKKISEAVLARTKVIGDALTDLAHILTIAQEKERSQTAVLTDQTKELSVTKNQLATAEAEKSALHATMNEKNAQLLDAIRDVAVKESIHQTIMARLQKQIGEQTEIIGSQGKVINEYRNKTADLLEALLESENDTDGPGKDFESTNQTMTARGASPATIPKSVANPWPTQDGKLTGMVINDAAKYQKRMLERSFARELSGRLRGVIEERKKSGWSSSRQRASGASSVPTMTSESMMEIPSPRSLPLSPSNLTIDPPIHSPLRVAPPKSRMDAPVASPFSFQIDDSYPKAPCESVKVARALGDKPGTSGKSPLRYKRRAAKFPKRDPLADSVVTPSPSFTASANHDFSFKLPPDGGLEDRPFSWKVNDPARMIAGRDSFGK